MGVPRKDVRATVDDEVHKALVIFARRAGKTVAEYVEELVQADVSSKIGEINDGYHELARVGLVGKSPDFPGAPRSHSK